MFDPYIKVLIVTHKRTVNAFFFLNVNINVASSLVLKYTPCNYASYCQKKNPLYFVMRTEKPILCKFLSSF